MHGFLQFPGFQTSVNYASKDITRESSLEDGQTHCTVLKSVIAIKINYAYIPSLGKHDSGTYYRDSDTKIANVNINTGFFVPCEYLFTTTDCNQAGLTIFLP
jgi:hypothetical protein